MFEKIINDLIKKECREEALEILNLSSDNEKKEFLYYYKNEKYNVCCLLLYIMKDKLIGDEKMRKEGYFGNLTSKLY